MRIPRPKIGTTMYSVWEHRYYIKGKVGVRMEYVVCEGIVNDFYTKGYTEICLKGKNPNGHMTPYRYKLSDIGNTIFYTAKEAAELARKKSDEYDKAWLAIEGERVRRPWEGLLKG